MDSHFFQNLLLLQARLPFQLHFALIGMLCNPALICHLYLFVYHLPVIYLLLYSSAMVVMGIGLNFYGVI